MTPKIYDRTRKIRQSERERALSECREKVAAMMIRLSIATGHGDTFDDLLDELEAALRSRAHDPRRPDEAGDQRGLGKL